MEKIAYKFKTLLLAGALGFILSAPLAAETIYYTDTEQAALQKDPNWFSEGRLTGMLYPGSLESPLSSNNKVYVNYTVDSGISNINYLYGGLSENDKVSGNQVNFASGLVPTIASGGYSIGGDSRDNVFRIYGSAVVRDSAFGGNSRHGSAVNNELYMYDNARAGMVYGGRASNDGNAIANTVSVFGNASVVSSLYGGYSGNGYAKDNVVNIFGSAQICTDNEAAHFVYGGYAQNRDASANEVSVYDNATVHAGIYGGNSKNGSANDNMVNISDNVTVKGSVYGGYSANGNATGNRVMVSGRLDFGVDTKIYGGYSNGSGDTVTGNTLVVDHYQGGRIHTVANFASYEFVLANDLQNGDTVLDVINVVALEGATAGIWRWRKYRFDQQHQNGRSCRIPYRTGFKRLFAFIRF